MNILLIDKRVQDYETIVASIDPALAVGVVFDYYEDTFDTVKARIGALGLTNGTTQISVGLIQHNYRVPMFTMLASADVAPIAQVESQDPELERWSQFRDFITWCKTTPEINAAHFDMMACALYSDPDWKYIIDTLTTQTGVTVRASTDDTGSASLGGDWFLESHTGINLKTVYFTEAIEAYRGVLYLNPADIREYSTKGFATGSLVAWGEQDYGGTTPGNVTSGVVAVYSSIGAFAALKTDGSIVAWGNSSYGGTAPSSVTDANSGVVAVYSTDSAFAALKTDGSIVAWGNSSYGGSTPGNVSSGVVAVYSTNSAFAALKTDGSVITWGNSTKGGTNPGNVSSGVVAAYSTDSAFAALKTDGSIVTWGTSIQGGTNPGNVSSGVVAVYSTIFAFAALKTDGSVVAWGSDWAGGTTPGNVTGVVMVYSTRSAFAALKTDGSVITWGDSTKGGTNPGNLSSGVVAVYSTNTPSGGAFAALKTDGSIVAWGDSSYGGTAPSTVTAANSGVVAVYSTTQAVAALKPDGSIVAWGYSSYGGTAPSTVTAANSGVVAVYSASNAFAALKTTATTFDLSFSYYSNMDRYNILRKKENRRRVNLTTLNNNMFTLSAARDIQVINPNILTNSTLRIIVPDYVSSSYSITSTATIPPGAGSVIIACDEGEPVTISGTTLVNYGSYVYKREANNIYTKTTSDTISGTLYILYGGDGINSSGIALVVKSVPVLSTFTVESSKTFGAAPFSTTAPTSASSGAITYSSNAAGVATINASSGIITLVAAGTVTFTASQDESAQYNAPTPVTSNTLTVSRGTTSLSSFLIDESKTFGSAPFSIDTVPTSASSGAITYSSNASGVATINASSGIITLVAAGTATFTASQDESAQYNAPTPVTSNTLTVVPSGASSGAVTYTSSNTAIATVGLTTGLVTPLDAGSVTITASQASSTQYNAPTNTTFTITIGAAADLSGTTVTTSLANKNLTGTSFVNTVLTNVSLSGANLSNANFSGATVTGANFTNADISGATNLPAFSTTQKLQLLRNANNAAVSAVQISTPLSGAEINAAITTPIPDISDATFVVKAPAYNVSNQKVVTVTAQDVSNNVSLYIPMNSSEIVTVNGVAYTFNGTNILDSTGAVVRFITILGKPFRLYAGSIVGLNIADKLNTVKIEGDGLYDIMISLFATKT